MLGPHTWSPCLILMFDTRAASVICPKIRVVFDACPLTRSLPRTALLLCSLARPFPLVPSAPPLGLRRRMQTGVYAQPGNCRETHGVWRARFVSGESDESMVRGKHGL